MRALLVTAIALLCAAVETPTASTSPVLVELFTSEGCSSCPPADALLDQLAGTAPVAAARVIALGEHVDYWDQQGWKDRFSSRALTQRQEVYAAHFGNDSIYTPQMVVDGRSELVGSDAAAARRAIARAASAPHGDVDISIEEGRGFSISVSASALPQHQPAEIVVAITEDGLQSNVTRGENRGRRLSHTAVVRTLLPIGDASSGATAAARTELTPGSDWVLSRVNVVAFVQERRSRAILASAAVPLVHRP